MPCHPSHPCHPPISWSKGLVESQYLRRIPPADTAAIAPLHGMNSWHMSGLELSSPSRECGSLESIKYHKMSRFRVEATILFIQSVPTDPATAKTISMTLASVWPSSWQQSGNARTFSSELFVAIYRHLWKKKDTRSCQSCFPMVTRWNWGNRAIYS